MNSDNNISGFSADDSNSPKRVQLDVLGVSYSQLQSGAYAVILAERHGPLRLPIVVGGAEAQAIAIKIEGITPPRPMTHDLLASLMHAYGLELLEVFIHKFEDGIFSSELTFINRDGDEVQLDARTSDAIAIAMRTGAPIYTTEAILTENGFTMETAEGSEPPAETDSAEAETVDPAEARLQKLAQLKEQLARAIENEAYEEASRLNKEISELENSDI